MFKFLAGRLVQMAILFVIFLTLVSGRLGVIALAASTVAVLGCGHMLTRRLGGLTGDSYGAIAVVTETAVLFVAVALSAATQ